MTQAFKRRVYPFTAIVGQEEMKLALLLNVIDPRVGGVMIMGDRGTGKSTTIRALADLLPEIPVVAGDPYNSSPTDPDLQSSEVRPVSRKTSISSSSVSATDSINLARHSAASSFMSSGISCSRMSVPRSFV